MPEAIITQRPQNTLFSLTIGRLMPVALYPVLWSLLLCRRVAERARSSIASSQKPTVLASTMKVQSAHVDKTFGENDRFLLQYMEEKARIQKEKAASIDFSSLRSVSFDDFIKRIVPTHDDVKYGFVWKHFLPVRFWLCEQEYDQLVDDITKLLNAQSVQNESLKDIYGRLQYQIEGDLTVSICIQIRKIMHACIGDQPATYQNRPIAQSLQALLLLPSEPALQAEKNYFQLKHQLKQYRYVYHDLLHALFNIRSRRFRRS